MKLFTANVLARFPARGSRRTLPSSHCQAQPAGISFDFQEVFVQPCARRLHCLSFLQPQRQWDDLSDTKRNGAERFPERWFCRERGLQEPDPDWRGPEREPSFSEYRTREVRSWRESEAFRTPMPNLEPKVVRRRKPTREEED
jgi:hypothetical protein